MAIKFITTKGTLQSASTPYYRGLVQHESVMNTRQTYAHLSEKLGYTAARIQAAFLAFKKYLMLNASKGNISMLETIASVRNTVKGAFPSVSGPWKKGQNFLLVTAVALDPFKSALAGEIPVNKTDGAKPLIKTVLDNVTGEYDLITGQDAFTIAGTDLGPDTEKEDEFVGVRAKDGTLVKAVIDSSDLNTVKAHFATSVEAGEYTLVVATRSGLGEEFGVAEATRKITIK